MLLPVTFKRYYRCLCPFLQRERHEDHRRVRLPWRFRPERGLYHRSVSYLFIHAGLARDSVIACGAIGIEADKDFTRRKKLPSEMLIPRKTPSAF